MHSVQPYRISLLQAILDAGKLGKKRQSAQQEEAAWTSERNVKWNAEKRKMDMGKRNF